MCAWTATVELPPTAVAPRAARRVVAALLDAWGVRELAEDAELLATEMVTNAVEHARSSDHLLLEASLTDGSCGCRWPTVQRCCRSSRSSITSGPAGAGCSWSTKSRPGGGVEACHSGKRVWFVIEP